jgi:hypothetical protein
MKKSNIYHYKHEGGDTLSYANYKFYANEKEYVNKIKATLQLSTKISEKDTTDFTFYSGILNFDSVGIVVILSWDKEQGYWTLYGEGQNHAGLKSTSKIALRDISKPVIYTIELNDNNDDAYTSATITAKNGTYEKKLFLDMVFPKNFSINILAAEVVADEKSLNFFQEKEIITLSNITIDTKTKKEIKVNNWDIFNSESEDWGSVITEVEEKLVIEKKQADIEK